MLMKHLLICPSERPAVSLLAREQPLAAIPLLGQSLLEYWLSSLAASGVKEVIVLAHDRPKQVQDAVGNGSRWGINLELIEESRELSPAQALLKYASELDGNQVAITVLDRFPGEPEVDLWSSYRDLFGALLKWMPKSRTPDRVGVKEISPGVWVGSHSVVSPKVTLLGPCWIGNHVHLSGGSVIGPNAIVEDGSFLEAQLEISNSCIGPNTFLGKYARVMGSFAYGSTLLDWHSEVVTEVPDPFLMCALRHQGQGRAARWFARASELYSRNKEEAGMLWKQLLLNKEG